MDKRGFIGRWAMEKTEDTSAQPPASSGQEEKPSGTLRPNFKMVFRSLIALTALSLVVQLALITGTGIFPGSCAWGGASPTPPEVKDLPPVVKDLLRTCALTWQLGFGAVVTLAVGKALEILRVFKALA
jgi:hypothetical protein